VEIKFLGTFITSVYFPRQATLDPYDADLSKTGHKDMAEQPIVRSLAKMPSFRNGNPILARTLHGTLLLVAFIRPPKRTDNRPSPMSKFFRAGGPQKTVYGRYISYILTEHSICMHLQLVRCLDLLYKRACFSGCEWPAIHSSTLKQDFNGL
jgi:hypothetical protein